MYPSAAVQKKIVTLHLEAGIPSYLTFTVVSAGGCMCGRIGRVMITVSFMETTRQAKIGRLLQKELSEIFRRETAKTHGVIVTVSAVRTSPDLSVAKAYLSVFPSEQGAGMLESINRSSKTIRYELAQKVRYQLRKVPELQFYIDDSLDYLENIDNLLKADEDSMKAAAEK